MKLRDTIPAEVLDHRVVGLNLPGERLGEVIGDGQTLLLFLRHLG